MCFGCAFVPVTNLILISNMMSEYYPESAQQGKAIKAGIVFNKQEPTVTKGYKQLEATLLAIQDN